MNKAGVCDVLNKAGVSDVMNKAGVCDTSVCYVTYQPFFLHVPGVESRSGELRTQKLNSHLFRIQSLKVLPLKPGVGQYTAIHATLTARDFFLAYFYPSGPFACIFSKTSPNFLCVDCG